MSHARPIPEASVAPWPAHPAPIAHHDDSPAAAPADSKTDVASRMPSQRAIAVGAGMAIGSAAIVAALLYMRSPARR